MGSRWEEHPSEPEQGVGDRSPFGRAPLGLEANELDLLRNAPDYDAEEMASVRPLGGWPSPQAAPAAEPEETRSRSTWMPPNRIEPPARMKPVPVAPPVRAILPQEPTSAAVETARARFPEERTMALMAEDLLGRPLDEPAPAAMSRAAQNGPPQPAWNAAGGGADLWDSAMPLLAEG
jgi:hypothetical protein